MLTPWEKIVFAALILATAAALLLPIFRRFRIIRAGRPSARRRLRSHSRPVQAWPGVPGSSSATARWS